VELDKRRQIKKLKKTLSRNRVDLEYGCDLYEEGKFKEAFLAFQRAAKLGNPQAQVNLGNLYDAGEGVEQDQKLAAYWYKRAIKNGVAEAAYNLARKRGHVRMALT